MAGLNIVGYFDYEKQDASNDAWLYKLDGYFEMVRGLTLAGEWFVYQNDKYLTSAKKHYDVSGFSVFGVWKANPDKFQLFARFDHYEPNTEIADDERNLVIAGFDWTPFHASWRIQPNIWYTTYADSKRKADAVFNLTFFLSF